MKLFRWTAFAAIAAALAACSRPEPPPEPIRAVRTLVVAPGTSGGRQEFAAEIRARTESTLGFRVGGKLLRRQAEVGRHVAAGDVLAQLDPQDLRLAQVAARAAVRAAQADFANAAADIERFRELRRQGFISAAELDRRETALKAAGAQLEQARAQAGVQSNQAAYADLRAPAAGVVTAVVAEPGAVVAAGAPVLRLAHDGPRDAVFDVPESDVRRMRQLLGHPDTVAVRPWGQPSTPATLREVAAAADPATRTFQAKADVGRAAVQLGQTATVLVARAPTDGAIRLPLSALWRQQQRTAVWVVDPKTMTVAPRPIEIGAVDGESVVVAGGLPAGSRVVTAGVHVLTAGQTVRLYEEPR